LVLKENLLGKSTHMSRRRHDSDSKRKIKRAISRRHSKNKPSGISQSGGGSNYISGIHAEGGMRKSSFRHMMHQQNRGASPREIHNKRPGTLKIPDPTNWGPPEFDANEAFNGIGFPPPQSDNRDPIGGSPCHFNCFGQDVIVKPGDCIRCPEEAYCPDNLKCSTTWMAGSNYIDTGWACCGCAADYSNTGSDNPEDWYGQRLGHSYVLWLGNGVCNDGGFTQTYYLCTQETCGPSDCQLFPSYCSSFPQLDNYGTIDGEYYWGGPHTWDNYPGQEGNSAYMYNHTFYWSETPPAGEWESGIYPLCFGDACPTPQHEAAIGWGRLQAHLACAEWGWDCGDVLVDSSDSYACGNHGLDPDHWTEGMDFDFSMTPGSLPDPKKHCNWKLGLEPTCEHKCNRNYYKDDAGTGLGISLYSSVHDDYIKKDPGGFTLMPPDANSDVPNICYCDDDCPACGCNPVTFCGAGGCADGTQEMQLYRDCLASCPGDCLSPSHIQTDMPVPFDTLHNVNNRIKNGAEPGLDCQLNFNDDLGDCCSDWKTQCWLPYPELPCECYDQGVNVWNLLTWPNVDCAVHTGTTNCVYGGPTNATCVNNAGCAQTCESFCNNYAEAHVNPASWYALVTELDNHACTVWNYNSVIRQEPDMSEWFYTPTCVPQMKTNPLCPGDNDECAECDGNTCKCDCVCFDDDVILLDQLTDFGANANVGCNDPMACNQVIQPDGQTPNCSREDVERYGVSFWTDAVGPYGTIVNDEVGVPYCIYPAGSLGATIDCSVYDNEDMCNSISSGGVDICHWSGAYCICSDGQGGQDNLANPATCPVNPLAQIDEFGENGLPTNATDITQSTLPTWDVIQLYTWIKTYDDALSIGEININQWNAAMTLGSQVGTVQTQYNDSLNQTGRINWIQSGCKGCPDPWAGNYTGHINRELYSGAPFDSDGNPCPGQFNSSGNYISDAGEACNTSWCYYETGCGDPAATNYVGASELDNNGFIRGGLKSIYQTGIGSGIHFPFTDVDFETMLAYNAGTSYNDFGYDGSHPLCQAPNGCRYLTTTDDHNSACSYDIINFCGDDTACNYSADCAPSINDTTGTLYETTVNSVPFTCGEHDGTLCEFPISYCQDNDGDGIPGINASLGCDMTGSVFGGAGLNIPTGPDDARIPTCTSCYPINPDCSGLTDTSVSCNNYELIGGPVFSGYNQVPCDPTSGLGSSSSEDVNDFCSTNNTHADFCLGANILGQSVVPQYYEHDLSAFSLTDCCSNEGCCATGTCDTYDGGGTYSTTLPCCYRDDDCGNCKPPNKGLFVVRESGLYQDEASNPLSYIFDNSDESICLSCTSGSGGCIADADSIFDVNGYVQGVVRMESSESPGVYFCNCQMETQLGCDCDINGLNTGNACGGGAGTISSLGCDSVCSPNPQACVGCCDDPEYPCGFNYGDPNFPDFINDCDCNGNIIDCNGECGGTYVIGNFYKDADNDDYCVSGIVCDGTNSSTCNEIQDYCYDIQNIEGTRPTPPADWDGKWLLATECRPFNLNTIDQDEDDTIDCESNVIDDCGVCDGDCVEGVPYSCDLIGCSGLCPQSGGDLDYINSCGYCINPVGGGLAQQSNSNGYTNPVTGLDFEYGMDQCGLCPPSQDDADGNIVGSSYQVFNSIQEAVTINYGSFGCENNQYFDPSFYEGDWDSCGVRHCACQCAGCTNMASPAWNPFALYDVSEIFGQNSNSTGTMGYNWMLADIAVPFIYDAHSTQGENVTDVCSINWEDKWNQCTVRIEVLNDFYDAYNYLCDNPGNPYCVFDEVVTLPNGMASFLYWDSLQATCWETHAGLKFKYCWNDVTSNSACAGSLDHNGNPIVVDGTCDAVYGTWCCGDAGSAGTSNDQSHCRVGIRSEMVWDIVRGGSDVVDLNWEGSEAPEMGDINYDGIVDILDIIQMVNMIMNDQMGFVEWQTLIADVTGDGIVDILDIIQLINLILERRRGSGTTSRVNQIQKRELIRTLKPMFNNSVHSKMRLRHNGNWLATRNLREDNTIIRNTISRQRGDYNMNFFNFLFNAPTCIDTSADGQGFLTNPPHIEYGDYSNIQDATTGEYGPNFNILPWQVTKFTAVDGQDYMMVGLGQAGQNIDLSVAINDEYMLMSIWHPNVHIQSDSLLRQLGGTIQGNAMYFIPSDTATNEYCTNTPDWPDAGPDCATYNQEDCDINTRCMWVIEYSDVAIYDTYGVFGYFWENYSWDTCLGGDCYDNKFYWLPRQVQCNTSTSLNTNILGEPHAEFGD